jgi:hypothetical protein
MIWFDRDWNDLIAGDWHIIRFINEDLFPNYSRFFFFSPFLSSVANDISQNPLFCI